MPRLIFLVSVLLASMVTPAFADNHFPAAGSRRPPSHQPGEIVDVSVRMRDGVPLHGTVYLPKLAPGERVPTVLDLGPYYGVFGARDTDEFDPVTNLGFGDYQHLLVRGYAVALFSLRGSGLSGGCLNFGGRIDQQDGYELVEWLGERDWSNGNVGMTGYSYDGSTPWAVAVAAPPALKTIVPVAGISDWYSYSFRRGVPYAHGPFFNAYYPAITEHAYAGDRPGEFARAQSERGCPERPEIYTHGFVTYATGDHDAFWDERDYRARADEIKASILLVHGLQENNVRTDHTVIYDQIDTPKAALLGQWGHGFPWMTSGLEHLQDDYEAFSEAWFDQWLRDGPSTIPAVAFVQDNTDGWSSRTAWPGDAASAVAFHLGNDGRLSAEPGEDPLGWFLTPPGFAPNPPGGMRVYTLPPVVDETLPVDPPPHTQLAWVSDETSGVRLSGEARLELTLSVDRPNAMLVGHLYDVAPDGTWSLVSYDYLDLRHRDSLDSGKDMPLLEPTPVELRFLPVEHVFLKGHRIGVILAGEAGQPLPHGSTRIKPALAKQTVHAGSLYGLERDLRKATLLSLEVHGIGNKSALVATLTEVGDSGTVGTAIQGRLIHFFADDDEIGTAVTDDEGRAQVSLPPRYRSGRGLFEAVFEGDDFYEPSSAST